MPKIRVQLPESVYAKFEARCRSNNGSLRGGIMSIVKQNSSIVSRIDSKEPSISKVIDVDQSTHDFLTELPNRNTWIAERIEVWISSGGNSHPRQKPKYPVHCQGSAKGRNSPKSGNKNPVNNRLMKKWQMRIQSIADKEYDLIVGEKDAKNYLRNLRWSTPTDNMIHEFCRSRMLIEAVCKRLSSEYQEHLVQMGLSLHEHTDDLYAEWGRGKLQASGVVGEVQQTLYSGYLSDANLTVADHTDDTAAEWRMSQRLPLEQPPVPCPEPVTSQVAEIQSKHQERIVGTVARQIGKQHPNLKVVVAAVCEWLNFNGGIETATEGMIADALKVGEIRELYSESETLM